MNCTINGAISNSVFFDMRNSFLKKTTYFDGAAARAYNLPG
jgi:hypothetical protein